MEIKEISVKKQVHENKNSESEIISTYCAQCISIAIAQCSQPLKLHKIIWILSRADEVYNK